MTALEQKLVQHELIFEKIKALDTANKAILKAKMEYDKIVEYYNRLGV